MENKPENTSVDCYCGSGKLFAECCGPFILGKQPAPTAEALMRSRYSAYATQQADYLVETTAAATRKFHNKAAILEWSESNKWVKLEILFSSRDVVEFKAYYLDAYHQPHIHHERSKFVEADGRWFYLDYEYY